ASDANAALIYGDEARSRDLLNQLNSQLAKTKSDQSNQSQIDDLKKQATDLANKLNKITTPEVTPLATLSNASNLIILPTHLATETQRTIVSWNRQTGK